MPKRNLNQSHWPLTILSSLAALLNMFLPLIMVRILLPQEVGEFRIFFLYLMMIPSLCLTAGMLNGIYFWAGKKEDGLKLIQTAGAILLTLSVAIPLLALLFHSLFSKYLNWSPIDWPSQRWNLFFLAATPTLFLNFYDFSAIATGNIWRGALFGSLFDISRTCLLIFVSLWKRDLASVLWTHIFVSYIRIFFALFLSYKGSLLRLSIQKEQALEVLKYAMPVSIAAVFDILMSTSDRIMLSSALSPSDFAFYTVGCLSIPPLLILEQSVNKTLIPRLGKAMHSKNTLFAVQLYSTSMGELLSFYIPTVIGIIVFASPIIHILFTDKYTQATPYLRLYSFTYLFLSIPHDSLARALGDGKWIMRTCIVFGTLSIGIVFTLTKFFGAFGALAGLLLGQILFKSYALVHTKRRFGTTWKSLLPLPKMARSLFFACTLAVASLWAKHLFSSETAWFLVFGPLFGLIYLSLLYSPWITNAVQKLISTKLVFRDL